MHDMRQTENII